MKLKLLLMVVMLIGVSALFMAYNSDNTEAKFENYTADSPSNNIGEGQIRVYGNKVILDVHNTQWASYEETDSMKPVLDNNAHGLEIVPSSEKQIKVGDIVSYQAFWNESLVVHRVVDKGEDAFGAYFILKGDNNEEADPGKVRFSQIKYKTIAIIY